MKRSLFILLFCFPVLGKTQNGLFLDANFDFKRWNRNYITTYTSPPHDQYWTKSPINSPGIKIGFFYRHGIPEIGFDYHWGYNEVLSLHTFEAFLGANALWFNRQWRDLPFQLCPNVNYRKFRYGIMQWYQSLGVGIKFSAYNISLGISRNLFIGPFPKNQICSIQCNMVIWDFSLGYSLPIIKFKGKEKK